MDYFRTSLLLTALLVTPLGCSAQASTSTATEMTPEQQRLAEQANKDFSDEKWVAALAEFKALEMELPNDLRLPKFVAEATINTGDRKTALAILLPIERAHPEDWQAGALLARIYAEERRDAARDAELSKLKKLHEAKTDPMIGRLQQVLLERDVTAKGSVCIWYSLEPWGRYKTYVYAKVYGPDGVQTSTVTLESSDFDQPLFAKEHPKEAAAGERRFSMDGYSMLTKLPNGTATQTHSTFGFYDAEPSYDTVRDRILSIARGDGHPVSSSTLNGAKP